MRKIIVFGAFFFTAQVLSLTQRQETLSNAEAYSLMRAEILRVRNRLAQKLVAAKSPSERESVLKMAREQMYKELVDRIFPAWYGTTWDFNGTSETPRKGKIACGYFVSTTLRDMGTKLNRYRVAQLYSHDIVRRLTVKPQTFLSLSATLESIAARPGTALYVVGLDQHVGFLVRMPSGEIRFVHASYGTPAEVLSELAKTSEILAQSKKFVLGRIDEPKGLVEKWLMGSSL